MKHLASLILLLISMPTFAQQNENKMYSAAGTIKIARYDNQGKFMQTDALCTYDANVMSVGDSKYVRCVNSNKQLVSVVLVSIETIDFYTDKDGKKLLTPQQEVVMRTKTYRPILEADNVNVSPDVRISSKGIEISGDLTSDDENVLCSYDFLVGAEHEKIVPCKARVNQVVYNGTEKVDYLLAVTIHPASSTSDKIPMVDVDGFKDSNFPVTTNILDLRPMPIKTIEQ